MTLKCDCGGILRTCSAPSFDFSDLAGLPVEVKNVPCLQCDQCGSRTLRGEIIAQIFSLLTRTLVQQQSMLAPKEIRFLRKELRLTPASLAKELGVDADTVRSWEAGKIRITAEGNEKLRHLVAGSKKITISTSVAEHVPPPSAPRWPQSGRITGHPIIISDGWTQSQSACA